MNAIDHLLGLDIGGTKCTVVLGTAAGEVVSRRQWPSRAERGPEAMLADLIDAGRSLINEAKASPAAVGVAIGGPMNGRSGVIHSPPNLPGWDDLPLRERLVEAFGLPVAVHHDAVACALAEQRWGAAAGAEGVAYLTCGTGFGMGLVLGGRPYYGAGGRSGELGHARFARRGPTAFGKAGSVEAFCAGASLPKLAAWRCSKRWGDAPPDGPALSRLAGEGDADAIAVLLGWADAVGTVAANVADALLPDAIVLGPLATRMGSFIYDRLRSTFEREALPATLALCRLTPAGLGERLQDCSALAAATLA